MEETKEMMKREAALELLELSVKRAGCFRHLRELEERYGITAEEIHAEATRLPENAKLGLNK